MSPEPLFTLGVEVAQPHTIGAAPGGESRVVAFTSGEFEGPGLRGTLLPGGSDWQRVHGDGTLEIRAHYMLQSDRGETVEVLSEGLRTAAPDVLARLAAGEAVPPDQYYFRTFIRMTTSAPRLLHFNRRLYYGVGEREAKRVRIRVYPLP
ncbi:MAG: DUF3237 domain-containing protein [Myxococcales bacterium]|nr:DUF3237 domain-containing protein [Myxococcales bacterium]